MPTLPSAKDPWPPLSLPWAWSPLLPMLSRCQQMPPPPFLVQDATPHLASSSRAIRRRMWLVADAVLRMSTALWDKNHNVSLPGKSRAAWCPPSRMSKLTLNWSIFHTCFSFDDSQVGPWEQCWVQNPFVCNRAMPCKCPPRNLQPKPLHRITQNQEECKISVWIRYLSLVTPIRESPLTSRIWSPGCRRPRRENSRVKTAENTA